MDGWTSSCRAGTSSIPAITVAAASAHCCGCRRRPRNSAMPRSLRLPGPDSPTKAKPSPRAACVRLAKGSAQANLGWVMSNCGRANAHYDRVKHGIPDAWARGPILDEADYPQVLVARAVTDGDALDLVLRPGECGGRRRLGLARLRPGATYTVRGGVENRIVAGADGTAVA